MSTLARQQQALLQALWQPRHEDAVAQLAPHAVDAGSARMVRGLRAYRSNGRALAQRALQGAFPVVAQLLGQENFDALATGLWLRQPPLRGDLAQWGDALPAHLESLSELIAEEPYLADVARVEWALHAVATAPDGGRDAASFGLLLTHEPAHLHLVTSPGAAWLDSGWPVVSIVLAHQQGEPSLQEAGQRLREGVSEAALVWREGLRPRVRALETAERPLVAALLAGDSLGRALDAAPGLDFSAWLGRAVQDGLVLGVRTDKHPEISS